MPTNKNALIRYQALDRCFRNGGRRYFWQDLVEACNAALLDHDPGSSGIQKRQFYEDVKFMESPDGWSVELTKGKVGKRTYYRYADLNFSINNQPLNPTEAEQIKAALQVLSRFSGAPQFEWVEEVMPKLSVKFGLVSRPESVISFADNIDLHGVHFIAPLFAAITNQQVLRVEYQHFDSPEPYQLTFHPYHLKQYNNRWFCFGYNPAEGNETWNLALDRIKTIEEIDIQYKVTDLDWDDYFYDMVGVTRSSDQSPQKVELLFSNTVAPYVITKPLHPTQKTTQRRDGLLVSLSVILNYELAALILSFGANVEVLKPKQLRDQIIKTVNQASSQYCDSVQRIS